MTSPTTNAVDSSRDKATSDGPTASPTVTSCLFCFAHHADLTANLSHMRKSHGFAIPYQDLLLVDLETFLTYLSLVIEDYCECLACGTQRATSEGARQHMLARGHCSFDLNDEGSEFREFYDLSALGEEEHAAARLVKVEDGFVRLESGKVLGKQGSQVRHRSAHATVRPDAGRATNDRLTDQSRGPGGPSAESMSTDIEAPRPAEKKAAALGTQLARLSAADRTALAHLAPSEQRSRLAVVKKQIDEARRSQRAMQSRVERLGNKTLMKHFVPDVPGPKNG